MSYLIAAVNITDYKKLRDIQIKPDADSTVILLAGANAQGKSSILDAIEAALGGKGSVAADPVRHGADEAQIIIELEGDEKLTVRRRITADGATTLEVRDELGAAVRSPQAVLDKLVGARFLDPVAFLNLKPNEQRAHLLQLVDRDGKIAKLDERRQRCFDLRTEVNRDLKKATVELERIATATAPAAPVDVVDLTRQLAAVQDAVSTMLGKRTAHERAKDDHARATAAVTQAKAELEAATRRLDETTKRQSDAAQAVMEAADALEEASAPAFDASSQRAAIEQQINQAQEFNRKAAADAATWKRKQEIEASVKHLEGRSAELTTEIERVDGDKATILTAAKLPVDGLSVDAGGVVLNSAPLVQASGAEKLRVALGLAIAANPNLRDVWIRDGALLDDDSLKAVVDQAIASGVRVWIERVGDRDPGAIIIKDGTVATSPPSTQGKLPL